MPREGVRTDPGGAPSRRPRSWPATALVGLVVLIAIGLLIPKILSAIGLIPNGEELSANWSPPEGSYYLLLDGRRFLVADDDRDGRADRLVRPPSILGLKELVAADAPRGNGAPRPFAPVMPEPLRERLSSLIRLKQQLDLLAASPVDENGDGTVDLIVSVFGLQTRAGRAHIKPPAAYDAAALSELLRLETEIAGELGRNPP